MAKDEKLPVGKSSSNEVDAFLNKVAKTPASAARARGRRGRLLFAMDATASRGPTWDRAAKIQGDMFQETAALGGLDVRLAFYRGFGEFKVGPWTSDGAEMARLVGSVFCMAGETQIRKVLSQALNEAGDGGLDALVFVGDCVEEDVDMLGARAGELGLKGAPAFMFQEGHDPVAEFAFKQVARLSGGAYCRFDSGAPGVLRDLLGAVAVYAAGGRPALEDMAGRKKGEILAIAHQIKGG